MKMDRDTEKKMTNIERRDAGMAYISDEDVFAQQIVCRKILQRLNFMDRSDFAGISEVVKELFGKSDGAFVNPPFYCDYGKHIEVGKNFCELQLYIVGRGKNQNRRQLPDGTQRSSLYGGSSDSSGQPQLGI